MMEQDCRIWGTASEVSSAGSRDSYCVISSRAGGKYLVTREATFLLRKLDDFEKSKVTTWLVNQRKQGVDWPELTSEKVVAAQSFQPLSVIERRDRVLEWAQAKCRLIGSQVSVWYDFDEPLRSINEEIETLYDLCAHCEAEKPTEAIALLNFSRDSGFISIDTSSEMGEMEAGISLTFEGYDYVDKLHSTGPSSDQAFVAMWFGEEMSGSYDGGFEPAIREAGYRAVRVDRKDHNNKIDDEIIAEIRRSKFVVADFTCGVHQSKEMDEAGMYKQFESARGGVYFEAGFAKGLGREVIWTVRKDRLSYVHFDTRQYNHIVWSDESDLRNQLSKRISATLGDGPLRMRT